MGGEGPADGRGPAHRRRRQSTDHLVCGADAYWIDLGRRLVVRAESHPTDPLELWSSITEVVELQLGAQPEELFVLPPGAVTAGPG